MLNQLARYGPVAGLLEEVPGTTVLEVGSGSRGIARLLSPRWQVTAADVDFTDYGSVEDAATGQVQRVFADVCDLPFKDRGFDAVVAVDVLEHVESKRRPQALGELVRVSGHRLIVAVPVGEDALEADRRLAAFYERRGQRLPSWLVEHLAHGFPELDDLASVLEPHGHLGLLPNESVHAHELIAKAEALPKVDLLSAVLARLLEPAVRRRTGPGRAARPLLQALRGRDRLPSYRTIAVLDRDVA